MASNTDNSEPGMSNSLGEWTVISGNNVDAGKCIAGCNNLLHSEGSCVEDILTPGDENSANKIKDEHLPSTNPGSSRSSSSDIAVIDDEEETDRMLNSVDSGESLFSFLTSSTVSRIQGSTPEGQNGSNFEAIGEDLSDFSSVTSHIRDELNSDVDFNPGSKHYIHIPNKRLNLALNMVVVLTVTAVLGLGIGNFIGWSTMRKRFEQNDGIVSQSDDDGKRMPQTGGHWQLSQSPILKLKKLQDELILCIQQQKQAGSKVCQEDTNYWKERFRQLFEEDQDLQELLEKSQILGEVVEFAPEENEPSKCSNQAKEDFHNLKLDLIVKQMHHLQLLKNYEEIRHQEKLSKERLKKLEEENEELKMKLVEEDEEDQVMMNDLEGKIEKLRQENDQLKIKLEEEEKEDEEMEAKLLNSEINGKTLTNLEEQVKGLRDENKELKRELQILQMQQEPDLEVIPELVPLNRIDTLKSQIDEVFVENEELRILIKSMQEKRPNAFEEPKLLNDHQKLYVNELKHENEDLKVEIGKMRYRRFSHEETAQEDDTLQNMKTELNSLQEILQQEKEEAEKWKQMYNEIQDAFKQQQEENAEEIFDEPKSKKEDSSNKNDESANIKSSEERLLPNINWTDVIGKLNVPGVSEKLGNLGGAVNQILEDIWKMNSSVGDQFKELKKDFLFKWEELKKTVKSIPKNHKNGEEKKENEILQVLQNTMKKIYKTGVKFLFNPLNANIDNLATEENRFTKMKDSVKKIMGKLNRKWSILREAWEKSSDDFESTEKEPEFPKETIKEESDPESHDTEWYIRKFLERGSFQEEPEDDENEEYESQTEDNDWFIKRAQSREKHHESTVPDNTKFGDSWELRRAKSRKRLRDQDQQQTLKKNNKDDSNSENDSEDDYDMEKKGDPEQDFKPQPQNKISKKSLKKKEKQAKKRVNNKDSNSET